MHKMRLLRFDLTLASWIYLSHFVMRQHDRKGYFNVAQARRSSG